ncbi:nucleoside/nucleotide kinase family protein [Leifsonia sp. Root112D2]|uniref:nucleoside/nucleotide kinase family protein n=1 Tax=Leifsonia sp. Root112D2 TaxID=1736426 RepID=UPI000A97EB50|nr:nucleoside/nucleotide kinase family protein [Leifsonia sp. Root112D2]
MTTQSRISSAQIPDLVDQIRRRAEESGIRQIIGIVGAPGAGKSTLADLIGAQLGPQNCAVVPMDGFHLANAVIEGTPLQSRKGAIDTFDVGGYLSLLARLRANDEPVVYAPSYRRGLEEPLAASIAVPQSTMFVLTEGNYLLADEQPWNRIRGLLDETWFIDRGRDARIAQLIGRHMEFGMDAARAAEWANGSDEVNARLVESTRERADHVIRL